MHCKIVLFEFSALAVSAFGSPRSPGGDLPLASVHSRESYYKVKIVRLILSLVRRLVAYGSTAPFAAVNDYITALGVGLRLYGAQNSAALVCPVSRIYVNVQRAKAEWAVVA